MKWCTSNDQSVQSTHTTRSSPSHRTAAAAASFKRFDIKSHPLLLLLPARPYGFRGGPCPAAVWMVASGWLGVCAAFEVRLIFYQSTTTCRGRRTRRHGKHLAPLWTPINATFVMRVSFRRTDGRRRWWWAIDAVAPASDHSPGHCVWCSAARNAASRPARLSASAMSLITRPLRYSVKPLCDRPCSTWPPHKLTIGSVIICSCSYAWNHTASQEADLQVCHNFTHYWPIADFFNGQVIIKDSTTPVPRRNYTTLF